MSENAAGESTALTNEILGYMERHPRAADRAEGIAQWWLPSWRAAVSPAELRSCLDELALEGLIMRHVLVDGSVIYGAPDHDGSD